MKAACSYPGPGTLPGAGTVSRDPRSGLCVCVRAQACVLMPASFPKRKQAPNRARAGGGCLEGFNCWLPLTHNFPVSVLSSWHPSCSLYMYVIYCCLIVAVCMLHPLFCKAVEWRGVTCRLCLSAQGYS